MRSSQPTFTRRHQAMRSKHAQRRTTPLVTMMTRVSNMPNERWARAFYNPRGSSL